MKKMIIAAVAAMSLGAGAAYAQGLPAGTVPPVYGSAWSASQMQSDNLNMSTNQSKTGQAEAPKTAEVNGAPKGG